jgi:hypothetical protein
MIIADDETGEPLLTAKPKKVSSNAFGANIRLDVYGRQRVKITSTTSSETTETYPLLEER